MQDLQRVNLLIERRQREALQRLARQRNRSLSDLVREYIAAGLRKDNSQQRERAQALENARVLKQHILKRRGGKPISDVTGALDKIREERAHELLGRRR